MRKTSKTSGNPGRQHQCLFQWPATGIVVRGAGGHDWRTDASNSDIMYGGDCGVCEYAYVYVCVRVCVRARVCARACMCAHACACMRACVMCLQYTMIIFNQTDNVNN